MKVTLLFKNFAKKGASEPPEVDQPNFRNKYENVYCEKTYQNFFNFNPFFNSSIPLEKHINFLQIPFFDFGPKKPLKVKIRIFQVFWEFQDLLHILGRKFHFLQLVWAPNFSFRSMLTISAFYRSWKPWKMPILGHILLIVISTDHRELLCGFLGVGGYFS